MFLVKSFAAITFLLQLTYANPMDANYLDLTNCYKGDKRVAELKTLNTLQQKKNDCKKENPDENSVCFKSCLLEKQSLLNSEYVTHEADGVVYSEYKYYSDPDNVADEVRWQLLIDYDELPQDELLQELTSVRERVAKCEEFSFGVPSAEQNNCDKLAPQHQESLGKFISCIENALTC